MARYAVLSHHGIKGQKWGIRRYQNPDGTLTAAGRERYYKDRVKQLKTEYNNKTAKENRSQYGLEKYIRKNYGENYYKDKDFVEQRQVRRAAIGIGAAGAVAAGAILTTGAIGGIGVKKVADAGIRNAQSTGRQRIDNILNDKQTMDKMEANSNLYRILYGSKNDKQKIINDSLYTTDNEKDRNLYKNVLGNMQDDFNASKKEITYKLKNDVYTAQGKVLFDFALEAVGSDKSVDDLDIDSIRKYEDYVTQNRIFGMFFGKQEPAPSGYSDYKKAAEAIFNLPQKDKTGKLTDSGSKKLRDKLVEEGYGAVKDYTDADILGKTPKILLNASNDVSVEKVKNVGLVDQALSLLKLGIGYEGKKKSYDDDDDDD